MAGLEHTKSKIEWPQTNALARMASMPIIRLVFISGYLLRYSKSQLQFRYRDVFFFLRIMPAAVSITFLFNQLLSPLRNFFL